MYLGTPVTGHAILDAVTDEPLRLDKYLAARGIGSRRTSARHVAEGRVTVNGKTVTEPGMRVDARGDRVRLDGRDVPARPEKCRTIALNKPRGYICSTSSVDGATVYELIGRTRERLVPVGRLDKNSEGLLLMSNDGDLINRLTHPRHRHTKTYRVTVSGAVNASTLRRLRSGMVVDGYRTVPATVSILREGAKPGRVVLEFVLREGRKRQIRRMCSQVGLRVHRLVRVRIAGVTLRGLEPGEWRALSKAEITRLLAEPGGDSVATSP
jgi:23S rRNA pseudouridine2605 synthase